MLPSESFSIEYMSIEQYTHFPVVLTLYRCTASRQNSSNSRHSSCLARLMLLKMSKLSIEPGSILP